MAFSLHERFWFFHTGPEILRLVRIIHVRFPESTNAI